MQIDLSLALAICRRLRRPVSVQPARTASLGVRRAPLGRTPLHGM